MHVSIKLQFRISKTLIILGPVPTLLCLINTKLDVMPIVTFCMEFKEANWNTAENFGVFQRDKSRTNLVCLVPGRTVKFLKPSLRYWIRIQWFLLILFSSLPFFSILWTRTFLILVVRLFRVCYCSKTLSWSCL
jgi:hypothetical protein